MMVRFGGRYKLIFFDSRTGLPTQPQCPEKVIQDRLSRPARSRQEKKQRAKDQKIWQQEYGGRFDARRCQENCLKTLKDFAAKYNTFARRKGWDTGVPFVHNGTFVLLTNKHEKKQYGSQDAKRSYLEELGRLLAKYPLDFNALDRQGSHVSERPAGYLAEKEQLDAMYAKDLIVKTLTL